MIFIAILLVVVSGYNFPLYNYDLLALPFNLRPFVEDIRSAEKSKEQIKEEKAAADAEAKANATDSAEADTPIV
jgi:hypothetical protein